MAKLYLADGETQTIAGRRAPSVIGPYDRLSWGSVVVVRARPVAAGAPPVRFGVPRSAGWRLLGRSRADFRVLTHPDDRADLRRAADAAILTLDHWPSLQRHLRLDEPNATLADALWDLAGVLEERGRVRRSWTQLAGVDGDVPADSAVRAEVADRTARARARMAALHADTAARGYYLTHLADQIEAFVAQQQAVDRAHAVIRDADAVLGAADAPPPVDSAADLAEHTSAVLAAYRELTR